MHLKVCSLDYSISITCELVTTAELLRIFILTSFPDDLYVHENMGSNILEIKGRNYGNDKSDIW